ncbi:MAG: hypothetical protein DCC59_07350 [Chloroflexi bacterium]|nr:MAG: hypothetical protein DCC59_07350 [Chloroflexota bacterium]
MKSKYRRELFFAIVFGFFAVSACSSLDETATSAASPSPTSTSVWTALLEATPFAYLTPLPEPVQSAIDGLYVKLDQSRPQWWKCLRCADYRPAGGLWRLQFDKGVMRVFYDVTGWRSIASYSVDGDRIRIFNDPYCPEYVGEYRWSVSGEGLNLEVVNDPCAFDLRAKNLGRQSWNSCAVAKAPGCADIERGETSIISENISEDVAVYGGDSRFFASPADLYAHANAGDMPPPEGIQISYADEAIPYGLHRVLWWNGTWIEASVNDESFTAMGVQILGEQTIGWARVLFDGEEVWRGDTAAIWEKLGRHGGYIQISGFEPGAHVIRVEALGFDYRPVTVASFGFSRENAVQP